jgi:hypothetical protein
MVSPEIKNPFPGDEKGVLLPDEDSNLDKQNQNLSYCHYTIGQIKTNARQK